MIIGLASGTLHLFICSSFVLFPLLLNQSFREPSSFSLANHFSFFHPIILGARKKRQIKLYLDVKTKGIYPDIPGSGSRRFWCVLAALCPLRLNWVMMSNGHLKPRWSVASLDGLHGSRLCFMCRNFVTEDS